jgi:predicted dehydrogenase
VGHRVLNRPLEDLGFVSLHYPRNILCHLHVSWIDPHKVRETVVVGSEGRAAFNDLDQLEPLRIFCKGVHAARSLPGLDDPASQLVIRDGDIRSPRVVTDEPLRQELVHFVECVRHRLRPRSDGRFGTSVVRVLEAIDSSLAAQGAPIPVGGPAVDEVVA